MKFRTKRQGFSRCGSDSGISCDGTRSPDNVEEPSANSMGTNSSRPDVEGNSTKNSSGEFVSNAINFPRKNKNTSRSSSFEKKEVMDSDSSLTKDLELGKKLAKCRLKDNESTRQWNTFLVGKFKESNVSDTSANTSVMKSKNIVENIFARKRKISNTSASSDTSTTTTELDQQLFKIPKNRSISHHNADKSIYSSDSENCATPDLEIPKTQEKKSSTKKKRFSVENFVLNKEPEEPIGRKIKKRSRILRISGSESESSKSNENLTNFADTEQEQESSRKKSPTKKTEPKSINSDSNSVKDMKMNEPKKKRKNRRRTDTNINNNLDFSTISTDVEMNNTTELNTNLAENEAEKEIIMKSVGLNRKEDKISEFDGVEKKRRRSTRQLSDISGVSEISNTFIDKEKNPKDVTNYEIIPKDVTYYEKKFNTQFSVSVNLDPNIVCNWLKHRNMNECDSPSKNCRILLERVSPEKPKDKSKRSLILNRNWDEFEVRVRPKPKFQFAYKNNVNTITSKNEIFKEAQLSEGFQPPIVKEVKRTVNIKPNTENSQSTQNIMEEPKKSIETPEIAVSNNEKSNRNKTNITKKHDEPKITKITEKENSTSESKETVTVSTNKEKSTKHEHKRIHRSNNIKSNIETNSDISQLNQIPPVIKETKKKADHQSTKPGPKRKTKSHNKPASSDINRLTTETRIQIKTPERINEESKDKKEHKRSFDKSDHKKDNRRSISKEKQLKMHDKKDTSKQMSKPSKVIDNRLDEDVDEFIQQNSIETTQTFIENINFLSQYYDTIPQYRDSDYNCMSDEDHIDIVEEKFNWSPKEIENSQRTIAELLPESKLDISQKNKDAAVNSVEPVNIAEKPADKKEETSMNRSEQKTTKNTHKKTDDSKSKFPRQKSVENLPKKTEKHHDESKTKKPFKKTSTSHEHKPKTHTDTHENVKEHEKIIDKEVKTAEISDKSCDTNKIQESKPKTDSKSKHVKEVKQSEIVKSVKQPVQENKILTTNKNIEKELLNSVVMEDSSSDVQQKQPARQVQISDSLTSLSELKITITNTQLSPQKPTETPLPLPPEKPNETPSSTPNINTDSSEPHTPDSHPKTPDIVFPKPKTFKFEKNEVKRPPTRPKKVILKRPILSTPTVSAQSTPKSTPSTFKVPVSPIAQSAKTSANQSVRSTESSIKLPISPPKKQGRELDTISLYAETIGVESLADMSIKDDSEPEPEEPEEDFSIDMINFIPKMDPVKESNMKEWIDNTVKVHVENEKIPEEITPPKVKAVEKIVEEEKFPLIFKNYCNNMLMYGNCRTRKPCKFDHELPAGWEKEILSLSVEQVMHVYRHYRKYEYLLKKIFSVITGRLGELRDFNNLISMVKDVIELEMNTDRAPFINDIITALCKTGVTFHSIVEVVYKNANVRKHLRDLLSDILLNLTVDKGDAYENWPVIKVLLSSKNHDIDIGMIKAIIIECLEKESQNKDLYYKIYHDLLKNIPDDKLTSIFESLLNNFYVRLQKNNYITEATEFNARCQKLNITVGLKSDHSSPKTPLSTVTSTPQTQKLTNSGQKVSPAPAPKQTALIPQNFVPYQHIPKKPPVQTNISPSTSAQTKNRQVQQDTPVQSVQKFVPNITPATAQIAQKVIFVPNRITPPAAKPKPEQDFVQLLPNFVQNQQQNISAGSSQTDFSHQSSNYGTNYYQQQNRQSYNKQRVKPKVNYSHGWYPPQKRNLSNKNPTEISKVKFNAFEVNEAMYNEDISRILSLILKYKDNEHTDLFIKTSFDALLESSHNFPTFVGKLFVTARVASVNQITDKESMYILKTLGLNIVLYLIQANNWDHAYNVYIMLKKHITDDLFNVKMYIKENYSYFKRMLIIARMLIKKLDIENAWEMIRDYNFQLNGVFHGEDNDLSFLRSVIEELLITLKSNPFKIYKSKPWDIGLEVMQYVMKHNIDLDLCTCLNEIFLYAFNNDVPIEFTLNFVNNTPNWYDYLSKPIFRAFIVHAVKNKYFLWAKKLFLTAMNYDVYPLLFGNERSITIRTDYVLEEVHLFFDILFEKMKSNWPIQYDIIVSIKEVNISYTDDDPIILREYQINAMSTQARIANILNNYIKPAVTITKKNKFIVLNCDVVNNHLKNRKVLDT